MISFIAIFNFSFKKTQPILCSSSSSSTSSHDPTLPSVSTLTPQFISTSSTRKRHNSPSVINYTSTSILNRTKSAKTTTANDVKTNYDEVLDLSGLVPAPTSGTSTTTTVQKPTKLAATILKKGLATECARCALLSSSLSLSLSQNIRHEFDTYVPIW